MKYHDFPYNLPIWRRTFELVSPDGRLTAKMSRIVEVSMGNPTIGTLELSNGFQLDSCNPSFIWSDDSRFLVVPRYFRRFGVFRRQRLVILDVTDGSLKESRKIACYFQPETFLSGKLIVTMEPFSDAITVQWKIPKDLDQFEPVKYFSAGGDFIW
jgi:hypothetical protein